MSPNAKEYMLINLWRPIKPMNATKETPLRSYPICFLDSSTLSSNDFVYIDYNSLGLITALKENVNHKDYYYIVVFKQFHAVRGSDEEEGETTIMPSFHTAFADPAADETTENRFSFKLCRFALLKRKNENKKRKYKQTSK
mmetsp:Transcript_24037/g.25788  ORF Transcript_24037/g.25788 Transcript_24037/m.25788 type:complete len:141 (-) Transcript_24037:144-566(-)